MKTTWQGKYGYLYENEEIEYFSFEINAELIDGSFEGTVHEQEFSGLTGDLVHVKGFIEDDFISLVLTYPYAFYIDDEGKPIIDKNEVGHEVIYQGNFDHETGTWRGEWEIEVNQIKIDEETDEIDAVVGVWEMRRMV